MSRTFRTYHELGPSADEDLPGQVAAQRERLARRLARVRALWAVASGKGGVGKSAIAANLAAALAARGLRVGAVDADLNGPSLGRMLGARPPLHVDDVGVHPAEGAAGVRVMSSELLLDADAPVRWREPAGDGFLWQSTLEAGALREFLSDVVWGELDVLVLDLPPGTDKLARLFQLVPQPAGVLLVTTPSEAARAVVARSLRLVREHGAPLGLVTNMAGHTCPACGHRSALFTDDGGRRLAEAAGVETWAELPFEPAFARATDAGRPPVLDEPHTPVAAALRALAERVAEAAGAGTSAEAAARAEERA